MSLLRRAAASVLRTRTFMPLEPQACSRGIEIHDLILISCLELDRIAFCRNITTCSFHWTKRSSRERGFVEFGVTGLQFGAPPCSFSLSQHLTALEMDTPPPADIAHGLEMTQFSDESNDSTFHFQILQLVDQLYVWIGCNSARMGNLYAALPTRWDKTASVAALVGGGADSTGASMARRLSMRTGWSIILASNIPSNAPLLEAFAEQRLFQELRALGYIKSGSKATNGAVTPMDPI